MPTKGTEDIIVLDEFRLHDADGDGSTARMIAAASMGSRDPPLLTSIDDPHDVALLRTVAAGSPDMNDPREHAGLGHLVAGWQRSKRYRSRIAAASQVTDPSSYRLAVTESGINDEAAAPPSGWVGEPTSGEPIALLLIGVPVGTHAGLLVLVGRDGPPELGPTTWPLPLSRALGVRVYNSTRDLVPSPRSEH